MSFYNNVEQLTNTLNTPKLWTYDPELRKGILSGRKVNFEASPKKAPRFNKITAILSRIFFWIRMTFTKSYKETFETRKIAIINSFMDYERKKVEDAQKAATTQRAISHNQRNDQPKAMGSNESSKPRKPTNVSLSQHTLEMLKKHQEKINKNYPQCSASSSINSKPIRIQQKSSRPAPNAPERIIEI